MAVFVILLRAIGAGTHKVMSMAQWREGAEKAGFAEPQTFLATGNMIAAGRGPAASVEKKMNALVGELGLGKNVVAVVRTPEQMQELIDKNPFAEAAVERPSRMQVYFFAGSEPDFSWIEEYQGREKLSAVDGHLFVDYGGPISESPNLGPLIERRCGPGTARNWNTTRGLAERALARQRGR